MTSLVYRPPSEYTSGPTRRRALPLALPTPTAPELSVERWERWIAQGFVHDQLVRRRFQVIGAVCAVALIAGALLWF